MINNSILKLNRSLIFQGYGSLSAYEAGTFKTLYENLSEKENENDEHGKPLFDIVIGTGMGAVNAAIVISHVIENKTWKGSSEKLIEFWRYISTKQDIADKDPLFMDRWEELRKTNPEIATPDAARRYFAAKEALNQGADKVSVPSPKTDDKFLDPQNIWNLYDTSPLSKNIERFVKFPIATTFEIGEPRLLLVSTDVVEGTAVAFDSYEKEDGSRKSIYGNKGYQHAIKYDDGLEIKHVMASLSYPPLYQYIEIDGRAFWSGGITSNSLLRELIYQHRTFYKYKIGAENLNEEIWNVEQNLQRVPDLEVYLINLWSAKVNDVPRDVGGVTNRLFDIMFDGKIDYDVKVAEIVTDYIDLTKRLIGLAKEKGLSKAELEDILNIQANSKFRNGISRTYKDLIKARFSIYNVRRIERKEYLNSVSNQWADFTLETISALIKEGERDAAHDLIGGMDRTFEIASKVATQIQELRGVRQVRSPSESVEQKGDRINLKKGNQAVATITSYKLKQLDTADQELIKTYEKSMYLNYKIWTRVYPELQTLQGVAKAREEGLLEEIRSKMCEDLNNITNFLQKVGIHISGNYRPIEHICQEVI